MELGPDATLPLGIGEVGEAVSDLQARLAELDLPVDDPAGAFGPSTAEALRRFQAGRGLPATGVCDQGTFNALVAAGYHLGDRILYLRHPMLRGDDVAELQRRLSALGFDPGRIDGIFGTQTEAAVREFQHNAGLPADGRCGRETLADLVRLALRDGGYDLVTPLRERLRVRAGGSRTLEGRQIAVGDQGGFAPGVAALAKALYVAGAHTLVLDDPNPSRQAAEANAAEVDCYVGFRIVADRTSCATAYYRGFRYESLTSKRLAELVQRGVPARLALEDEGICGAALPILRETRMPAIELQLGCPSIVVQRTVPLAAAIVEALSCWVAESFD